MCTSPRFSYYLYINVSILWRLNTPVSTVRKYQSIVAPWVMIALSKWSVMSDIQLCINIKLSNHMIFLKGTNKMPYSYRLLETQKFKVWVVLNHRLSSIITQGGIKPSIVDTRRSSVVSYFLDDFVPRSMTDLPNPTKMGIIGSELFSKLTGRLKYEVLDDKGMVVII